MSARNNLSRPNSGSKPTAIDAAEAQLNKAIAIRTLNDHLRQTGQGGRVVVTDGITALGLDFAKQVLAKVSSFADFTENNDPHGEHDCAVMAVSGHRIIWKIDYYDRTMQFHSVDAADPKVTIRVLTIMTAQEY